MLDLYTQLYYFVAANNILPVVVITLELQLLCLVLQSLLIMYLSLRLFKIDTYSSSLITLHGGKYVAAIVNYTLWFSFLRLSIEFVLIIFFKSS